MMRKKTWLALALALILTASASAQSKRGFFGYDPSLFTTPTQLDPNNFPIPNQTTQSSFKLSALLPKFTSPIGKLNYARTTLPTYSPIGSLDYLRAFHYRPPQPLIHP